MIVRRFLLWTRMASAAERAEGASALARAYLYSPLSHEDRREADTALTALLDDPSPLVRRALADAFGGALDAPRHIVVALANDQSDVASIVLARSPVLSDADLIDCAAIGDEVAQTAVAIRPGLSAGVAAALAEVAGLDALIALADNAGAEIPEFSVLRMIERHGTDGRLREALGNRRDLPVGARQALMVALAQSLSHFASGTGWLTSERSERVTREARERATVSLATTDREAAEALAEHLRDSGQLTPALLLRALLSGAMPFVEAAFADLADQSPTRVAGLLGDPRGAGFLALYRKASLPPSLMPAFRAAFEAGASTSTRSPMPRSRACRGRSSPMSSPCASAFLWPNPRGSSPCCAATRRRPRARKPGCLPSAWPIRRRWKRCWKSIPKDACCTTMPTMMTRMPCSPRLWESPRKPVTAILTPPSPRRWQHARANG